MAETAQKTETPAEHMMNARPQKEHEWLQKLVGEWTYEIDAEAPPGQEKPAKSIGTESVRSLGGLWTVAEGEGDMGGEPASTLMTLGYDPKTKRFVGTWVGSMMTHMWVYDGELDRGERVLTLNATGESMTTPGKTTQYQDIIEFKSDDHRTLTGRMLGDDGKWVHFMTAHYRRQR
jgi:Protein of unknown function (DUF1579)